TGSDHDIGGVVRDGVSRQLNLPVGQADGLTRLRTAVRRWCALLAEVDLIALKRTAKDLFRAHGRVVAIAIHTASGLFGLVRGLRAERVRPTVRHCADDLV